MPRVACVAGSTGELTLPFISSFVGTWVFEGNVELMSLALRVALVARYKAQGLKRMIAVSCQKQDKMCLDNALGRTTSAVATRP